MKIQMKTLLEIMEIPGIEFLSNDIQLSDKGRISKGMFSLIGCEIKVIEDNSGPYIYQHGNYFISEWMIRRVTPEFILDNGWKISIEDGVLHVGCHTMSLDRAKTIAKFLEENM